MRSVWPMRVLGRLQPRGSAQRARASFLTAPFLHRLRLTGKRDAVSLLCGFGHARQVIPMFQRAEYVKISLGLQRPRLLRRSARAARARCWRSRQSGDRTSHSSSASADARAPRRRAAQEWRRSRSDRDHDRDRDRTRDRDRVRDTQHKARAARRARGVCRLVVTPHDSSRGRTARI